MDIILQTIINYGFLEHIPCFLDRLRNYDGFNFSNFLFARFFEFSKKEKPFNCDETVEDFRKLQRQNYSETAKVSSKPSSPKKLVIPCEPEKSSHF